MSNDKFISDDKFLFQLARQYVMLEDILENEKSNELEIEETEREIDKMLRMLVRHYYDIDKFNYYQKLYKAMTIEDYFKFLKTFE